MLMFQQMAGFSLLEGVLVLTLSSITTATGLSYLNDWIVTSEKSVLHYSQQVASSSMQTHQMWAKAAGKEPPKWRDVILLNGIESQVSMNGSLALRTTHQSLCVSLDERGEISPRC
jgi:type II secretory pathway pseudopilin PulG